jgi:hypothetical protein
MRERIFFTHSDPHGAAPSHGRFLAGMSDDDLFQRPIIASEGGSCCRCEIQGFQEEGLVPSKDFVVKRPQRASASKAKSSDQKWKPLG